MHPQQSGCNSLGRLCLFAVQSCLDAFRSFCGSHISLKNDETTEVFLLLKAWVSLFSLHHHTKPTNALVQSAFFPPNKVLPPILCEERQMAEGREQNHSFGVKSSFRRQFCSICLWFHDASLEVGRGLSVHSFCSISCSTQPFTDRKVSLARCSEPFWGQI